MSARAAPAPRALLHRGHVEVAALWFDPSLLGEAEARRRVLKAWAPGAEVNALGGGYLLRLPTSTRRECARAPGLPFTREDGVLLAVPLTPAEWRRLAPAPGSVVWTRAGALQLQSLEALARVDVSAWLAVSGWEVVREESLGAPPPPVAVFEQVKAPGREALGVGALSAEAALIRARMEGRAPLAPPEGASWQRGLATAWDSLFTAVTRWLARRRRESPPAPTGAEARALAPARPQGPDLFSRVTGWLARRTPLSVWLGRRQDDYLRRLFGLFAEGDLEQALRHAIPLGKEPLTAQAHRALGLPGPRQDLSLQPRAQGGGGTMSGSNQVLEALRERYRAAFQKLAREGRVEEAAFVLAELLREEEEAVSFLEREGRLRLAAELAEGRGLSPGLVVRQWMRAGEVKRAVDVARRTGAFTDAVFRLEQTHPAEARTLRLLWGEVLARAGHYRGAVDAVWPVEEARELAWTWLLLGAESPDTAGARMLARAVVLRPERFAQLRARVLALWEPEGPEEASVRYAFAHELAKDAKDKEEGSAVRGMLLGRTARELLRDLAAGHVTLDEKEFKRLVQLSGDKVLLADLWMPPAGPARTGPVVRDFDADVGGPWPIEDAVPLGDGRVLVALGELGARLLTRDGRCVAHFDVPAFSLVRSWRSHLVLAVAPRGSLRRVSRLDLGQRRARDWFDVRADAFAPEYDGEQWFIAQGDTVLALDALADEPRALWRVDRVGGPVRRLAAGARGMSFVCEQDGPEGTPPPLERWFYACPGLVLRSREPVFRSLLDLPERYESLLLRPTGETLVIAREGQWAQRMGSTLPLSWSPSEGVRVMDVLLDDTWHAVLDAAGEGAEGPRLRVAERTPPFVASVTVTLRGAHPGGALRSGGGELVYFDRSGWLVRVDLTRRTVQRIVPG